MSLYYARLNSLRSFFYGSSAELDLLWLKPGEACGDGTRTAGTSAGIGARPGGLHRFCRSRPREFYRPTDLRAFPRRSASPATPDGSLSLASRLTGWDGRA